MAGNSVQCFQKRGYRVFLPARKTIVIIFIFFCHFPNDVVEKCVSNLTLYECVSLSQYTLGDNQPYCKPHYERIFKESGGMWPAVDTGVDKGSREPSPPRAGQKRIFFVK